MKNQDTVAEIARLRRAIVMAKAAAEISNQKKVRDLWHQIDQAEGTNEVGLSKAEADEWAHSKKRIALWNENGRQRLCTLRTKS